jgi:hypothetical protein
MTKTLAPLLILFAILTASRAAKAELVCETRCVKVIVEVCYSHCWEEDDKPKNGLQIGLGLKGDQASILLVNKSNKPVLFKDRLSCKASLTVGIEQAGKRLAVKASPPPPCPPGGPVYRTLGPGKKKAIPIGRVSGLKKGAAVVATAQVPVKAGGKAVTARLRSSQLRWTAKWEAK